MVTSEIKFFQAGINFRFTNLNFKYSYDKNLLFYIFEIYHLVFSNCENNN